MNKAARSRAACSFLADTRFLDHDFYDGDHLNETGAVKFTRLFDDEVLRR